MEDTPQRWRSSSRGRQGVRVGVLLSEATAKSPPHASEEAGVVRASARAGTGAEEEAKAEVAASRWWCISAVAGSERGSARRTEEPRTPDAAPGGAEAEAGTGAEVGREALRQFKTTNPTVRTLSTRAATKRWRPLRCCTGLCRAARHGAARRGAAREEGLKSQKFALNRCP